MRESTPATEVCLKKTEKASLTRNTQDRARAILAGDLHHDEDDDDDDDDEEEMEEEEEEEVEKANVTKIRAPRAPSMLLASDDVESGLR